MRRLAIFVATVSLFGCDSKEFDPESVQTAEGMEEYLQGWWHATRNYEPDPNAWFFPDLTLEELYVFIQDTSAVGYARIEADSLTSSGYLVWRIHYLDSAQVGISLVESGGIATYRDKGAWFQIRFPDGDISKSPLVRTGGQMDVKQALSIYETEDLRQILDVVALQRDTVLLSEDDSIVVRIEGPFAPDSVSWIRVLRAFARTL